MMMVHMRSLNIKAIEKIYCDTTPLTQHANRKGKQSFIVKLEHEINKQMDTTSPTDADRIACDYLRKYLVEPGLTRTTIDNIRTYLFRRDFEDMILEFWRSVGKVWTPKLTADRIPVVITDDVIKKLSRWNGVRERALKESDLSKRKQIVQEVITRELLPLFVIKDETSAIWEIPDHSAFLDHDVADPDILTRVMFRYHEDVFIGSPKAKGKIRDALTIMSKIFRYDWLTDENSRYPPNLRHQIMSNMQIPVCPYCNRQYVTLYREGGMLKKTTADLDHFYIKSVYPYLALCVYNFVPSCQICNSRFKGDMDFYEAPHLYPYTQKTNSHMKFRLNDPRLITSIQDWNDGIEWKKGMDEIRRDNTGTQPPVIKITIEHDDDSAAANSERTFHLEEVYQSHRDYIYELIWKYQAYDDSKIRTLYEDFGTLFSSEDEVRALVFSQYPTEEEMHKRPLAKLTQDILEDCKLRHPSAAP